MIDADPETTITRIAHLLAPEAIWINHGSVNFDYQAPHLQLTAQEICELAQSLGFGEVVSEDIELPYMQSPASRQHRTERVVTQVLKRTAEAVTPPTPYAHQPQWVTDPSVAVPLTRYQTQITTVRIHAFILSLIDGKRSINDIAQLMEQQRLMPQTEAKEAIRQFLSTLHSEQQTTHRTGGKR